MEPDYLYMRLSLALSFLTLAVVIVFATAPQIDLWVSALYYDSQLGFWRDGSVEYNLLRNILRRSAELLTVLTFIMALGNIRLGEKQLTGWRVWAFLSGSVLICSGLLVNGILKREIGRVRPAYIVDFGGTMSFTPPFQIGGQCQANCSFTSGEASLVATLIFAFCVLAWPQIRVRGRGIMIIVAAAIVGTTCFLRIAMGRHFLSDVILSVLFSGLTVLALYRLLDIGRHRGLFTTAAVLQDARFISRGIGLAALRAVRRMSKATWRVCGAVLQSGRRTVRRVQERSVPVAPSSS